MMVRTKEELRAWHIEQAAWLRKYEVTLRSSGKEREANDVAVDAELHESAAEVLKGDQP